MMINGSKLELIKAYLDTEHVFTSFLWSLSIIEGYRHGLNAKKMHFCLSLKIKTCLNVP